VARLRNPPVDAAAASEVAVALPDDYAAVERYVLDHVRFEPAWTVYGLPWYFPTVTEVLVDRAGDCQARAILLASILEAKGLPYTLRYSFDHVWVDYPGKQVTELEDPATSFASTEGDGWASGLPDRLPIWSILKARIAYHWTPMPFAKKFLILAGAAMIFGYGERRALSRVRRALWPGPHTWTFAPPASTDGSARR
jgi:hypothetical protein